MGPGGTPVSLIGQGTWKLNRIDPWIATQALYAGLDAGMTHIDTAEMYGNGAVENFLGKVLRHRRQEIFLASKVKPHNATYTGLIAACERSLRRLRTDHLDLYLLHWPGPHPLEETLSAFRKLRSEGKILSFGVSNFNTCHLERLSKLTEDGEISCNQVLYNLGERAIEHHIIPECREQSIEIVGYSPLGSGIFPPRSRAAGNTLQRIATEHCATEQQIALAFLIRNRGLFLIPRTSNIYHVQENGRASEIQLSEEEVISIDHAYPLGPDDGRLPVI
ncbi:aldo/keto reductase [Streptomyces sp. NPDC002952]|uniref:aldo/keto reductase n=1 Tax=Streptomyces sp. NPDC002952 TaxID=3364673 RepID=UPI0036A62D66